LLGRRNLSLPVPGWLDSLGSVSAHLWFCQQNRRVPVESLRVAIYSLHHSTVGKSTQAEPFTASAHIAYITRARACTKVLGARMPEGATEAQQWLAKEELADRKNARVIDKVMLALPKELGKEQRAALVEAFAERITQGKASWLGAIHDRGKDGANPHCHLVIRDRDVTTGKAVARLSAGPRDRKKAGLEPNSTEYLRKTWEECANLALGKAERPERIDRRSLKARGLEREPTIHEGVRARQMVKEGNRPQSKPVNARNSVLARTKQRVVNYSAIDGGKSRVEHNRVLRRRMLAAQAKENQKDHWAAIDADRMNQELSRDFSPDPWSD
jgi:hypothetical protein